MKKILLFIVAAMAAAMGYAQNNAPLCFTARNGSVTVEFNIKNITHTIQYSTDGSTWNTYTSDQTVSLSANQSVYFRAATNQTTATAFAFFNGESGAVNYSKFRLRSTNGGTVEGSGNIMSLYGPDCPDLPLQRYAFYRMFQSCTILTTAPALPATTLAACCYDAMFNTCTSLTSAPALPAMTLADTCYSEMFAGCSSLVTPPALPAMTLAKMCYYDMFSQCTSLAAAPALPATTLAKLCYANMFNKCSSLVTPPALPADSLAEYCYYSMFYYCSSLVTPPALSATRLAEGCCSNMFVGCGSIVTPPALPTTTLAKGCYAAMFAKCTSLVTVPELPADSLPDSCYMAMFSGCSSLVVNTEGPGKEWSIAATVTTGNSLYDMFYGTGGTMNSTPNVNTTYYIASDTTVTPVSEVESSRYVAYSNDGRIFVNGAMNKKVSLYDLNGRLVAETPNANETHEFAVAMTGIYIVCIDDRNAVKVIVK